MSAPPDALISSSSVFAGGAHPPPYARFFLSGVYVDGGTCLHHPTLSFLRLAFFCWRGRIRHPTPVSWVFCHLKTCNRFSSLEGDYVYAKCVCLCWFVYAPVRL